MKIFQFPQVDGFHVAEDAGGTPALIRNDRKAWVRHYPLAPRGKWQAYRLAEGLPAERMPWTVNNKRIGSESGFLTFGAALDAAKTWEAV